MTVGELLTRASSLEIAEWRAYLALEVEERRRQALARRAEHGATGRKRRRRR